MKECVFCGAPRGRLYCRACGSVLGAPIVAWVLFALLGIGFWGILTGRVPHG